MPNALTRRLMTTATMLACLASPALADDVIIVAQGEAEPGAVLLELEVIVVEAVAQQAKEKPEATQQQVANEDSAEGVEDREGEDQKPEEKAPTQEQLRAKMNDLERELRKVRSDFQRTVNDGRNKIEQEKQQSIDEITLPENATREQSEAYVTQLREAAQGKRSFSMNDPIVAKLKALPAKHFDLLMVEMSNRTSLRYFANYALRGIDSEQLREQFVTTLEDNPNNIGIIVMNGWCEDVRPVIIQYMKSADNNVSPAWFQAAVELAEPELYPKLHEVTTGSRYASQFLNMLQSLPDYDLAHTVNTCWEKSSQGKLSVSQSGFAPMAAELGNVDALGVLITQMRSTTSYMVSSSTYNVRRTNVLKFIEYRGSNTEIQNWYNENKDQLVFDQFTKRFVLPEGS